MIIFEKTTHLSEIIEKSEKDPVIVFKYSSKCGSSDVLMEKLKIAKENGKIKHLIFIVVVQDSPVLSGKIAQVFNIKHESPQIIILNNNQVTYKESHDNIMIDKFQYGSID